MPDLRLQSRVKYMDKREKEKIEFAKKRLQDDELIFGNDELTWKEIKLRELEKKTLKIAEGHTVK